MNSQTQMDAKTCKKCSTLKLLSEFYAKAACTRDGHEGTCKACKIKFVAAWKKENPERARAAVRRWNKKHPEVTGPATKKWKDANEPQVRRYALAWQRSHPVASNVRNSKHRAGKTQRTPQWADHDAIRAMYQKAQQQTLTTGVRHHVDHIVPLRSKIVSGLHVHHNLQVLPEKDNMKKGNRHWPGMPMGA